MAADDRQTSQDAADAREKSLPETNKPKKRAKPRMFRCVYMGGALGGLIGILFLAILAVLFPVLMWMNSGQDTGLNLTGSLCGLTCFGPLLIIFCAVLGAIAGLVRSRM